MRLQKFITTALCAAALCSAALIPLTACNTGKATIGALIKDVDSYHRDLLFERYDIAAKHIAPESRIAWLEAIRAQGIRFAEIEILSTEDCTKKTEDAPMCTTVLTQMQWYAQNSPTIMSTRIQTQWQYDKEAKSWLLVEQNEL